MKTLILAIITLLLLTSGCKVMYIPNSLNVPLFVEKNEFKANIGFYDYQLAYSVTKNIGLMANGYVRNSLFSGSSDLNYSSSRNLFEGAIGYFKTLDKDVVFETYAGGGAGKLSFNGSQDVWEDNSNYKYSANFNRFFIQPSIGYVQDMMEVAFSARLARLSFNNIKTENYTQQMLLEDDIYNLDKTNYFFIEPALTFRVGYKWAKFQTQIVYSNKINEEPLNYQRFCLKVGLTIHIAPRFKSPKQN
jgi:hypothetical protein